jgi:very-short-patch-repair endonuclease
MPVPPNLLVFARQLRKEQTDAENLLWHLLRGRNFCGFKFRRQYPMCGYILDFYCHDVGLAVELDGGGHNQEEQQLYDMERTRIIESAGIRIVRFWNNDVLTGMEGVLEELYMHLKVDVACAADFPLIRPSATFSLMEKESIPKATNQDTQ